MAKSVVSPQSKVNTVSGAPASFADTPLRKNADAARQVGLCVGAMDGAVEGATLGDAEGCTEGVPDGEGVEGLAEGRCVGETLGISVGAALGEVVAESKRDGKDVRERVIVNGMSGSNLRLSELTAVTVILSIGGPKLRLSASSTNTSKIIPMIAMLRSSPLRESSRLTTTT
jgi:hypothetical protein